jgi:hypothetical protein
MVYSWIYPILEPWYNAGNMGHIKITEWLGVSEGWFTFGFAVISVVLFYVTNLIRKRVKPVHY